MSKISFRSIVNKLDPPQNRGSWVAYRFIGKDFVQKKHGSAAYDIEVNYYVDDYTTPDTGYVDL